MRESLRALESWLILFFSSWINNIWTLSAIFLSVLISFWNNRYIHVRSKTDFISLNVIQLLILLGNEWFAFVSYPVIYSIVCKTHHFEICPHQIEHVRSFLCCFLCLQNLDRSCLGCFLFIDGRLHNYLLLYSKFFVQFHCCITYIMLYDSRKKLNKGDKISLPELLNNCILPTPCTYTIIFLCVKF